MDEIIEIKPRSMGKTTAFPSIGRTFQEERNSGRTTRMLEEAIRLSSLGHAVYVMMHSSKAEHEFRRSVALICEKKGIDIPHLKYETWDSLGGARGVDLVNQKMIGAHPNCKLFIDHHFYGHYFHHVLSGFHQWDRIEYNDDLETPKSAETE